MAAAGSTQCSTQIVEKVFAERYCGFLQLCCGCNLQIASLVPNKNTNGRSQQLKQEITVFATFSRWTSIPSGDPSMSLIVRQVHFKQYCSPDSAQVTRTSSQIYRSWHNEWCLRFTLFGRNTIWNAEVHLLRHQGSSGVLLLLNVYRFAPHDRPSTSLKLSSSPSGY